MNLDLSKLFVLLVMSIFAVTACKVGLTEGDGFGVIPDDDDPANDDDTSDDDDAGSDDDDSVPVGTDDDDVVDPQDDDDDSQSGDSGLCNAAVTIACGDTVSADTGAALATQQIDSYACSNWDATGPELAYAFTPSESGSVQASLTDIEEGQDLDIYVLKDMGNGCASDDCVGFANEDIDFDVVGGDTYYILVDGYYGASGSFVLSLGCGGGSPGDDDDTVGPGDDDDTVGPGDDDDASAAEDCVDGIDNDADGAIDCADVDCASDANCSGGACVPAGTLNEGAVSTWDISGLGSTNSVNSYPCQPNWDESGPEFAYTYVAAQSGQVTVELTMIADELVELLFGTLDDLDVFVLDGSGSCDPGACIAGGDTTVTWNVTAGSSWYIVVDGYQGDISPYELALTLVP